MIASYLVIKIALQAILDEANRMAMIASAAEQANFLKSKVAQLELDYANGLIDEETYRVRGEQLIDEIKGHSGGLVGEG